MLFFSFTTPIRQESEDRPTHRSCHPCSYSEFTHQLYTDLLPQLVSIAVDSDRYRDLWADEDAELSASERAIDDGHVTIEERPELDLAIVRVAPDQPIRSGHRFGHDQFEGLHPMAINNATERFRVLLIHGRRYRFFDRYETWVQFRSRPTLPRVDMRPLAHELTALERGLVTWQAGSPGGLSPEMFPDDESTIEPSTLLDVVQGHLAAGDV